MSRLPRAAKSGVPAEVRTLLARGADPDEAADDEGGTALHWAAARGHVEVVRTLVEAGAAIDHADVDGVTALHLAATAKHLSVVRTLLEAGARVDLRDTSGKTPLLRAVECDAPKTIVDALLGAGADPDAADRERLTPRTAARGRLRAGLARAKKRAGAAQPRRTRAKAAADPFAAAIRDKDLRTLLRLAKDPDARTLDGRPPLSLCIARGWKRGTQALVARGMGTDTPDRIGFGPLWYAASRGDQALVEELLALGANPRGVASSREPALFSMLDAEHAHIALLLAKAGGLTADERRRAGQLALAAGLEDVAEELGASVAEAPKAAVLDPDGSVRFQAAWFPVGRGGRIYRAQIPAGSGLARGRVVVTVGSRFVERVPIEDDQTEGLSVEVSALAAQRAGVTAGLSVEITLKPSPK